MKSSNDGNLGFNASISLGANLSNRNQSKKPEHSLAEKSFVIDRISTGGNRQMNDVVAVEEPLEIRVVFGVAGARRSKSLSITMRTPGNDHELAAGFLISENIICQPEDLVSSNHVGPPPEGELRGNTLMVELAPAVQVDIEKLQRHFYTTSSCGVCGKASLNAVQAQGVVPLVDDLRVDAESIYSLPDRLRQQQAVFDRTGGLHAAGLVNAKGEFIDIREDVGRHNAVDKLIGAQLLAKRFPLAESVLVVSGRASFELMQKALMASIPMLVAVGAPSSLAVELAREFNMTLIGFTSQHRFNIYAGSSRVQI